MFQSHSWTINIFAHFVDLVLVCTAAENPSKVIQSVVLTQLCSLMLEHTGMVLTFILVFLDAEVHLWYSFLANTFLLKHRKLLTESPTLTSHVQGRGVSGAKEVLSLPFCSTGGFSSQNVLVLCVPPCLNTWCYCGCSKVSET